MVEFSFGFSRVSATPETVQKDRRMPVRLMGFPPLPSNKRPIYVIEQQNEAIYIQLNVGNGRSVSPEKRRAGSAATAAPDDWRQADRDLPGFRAVPEGFFGARRGLAGAGARHCIDDLSADPFHGASRHAWHCALLRIGLGLLERSDLPRRPCFCRAPARHDGRPREHFVYVARPEQCVSPLSCRAPRVALRFWNALRPSRRRLSRLHHDSRNILHCRQSAAFARGACRRPRTAVGCGSDAASRLLRGRSGHPTAGQPPSPGNAIGRRHRPMRGSVARDGRAPFGGSSPHSGRERGRWSKSAEHLLPAPTRDMHPRSWLDSPPRAYALAGAADDRGSANTPQRVAAPGAGSERRRSFSPHALKSCSD